MMQVRINDIKQYAYCPRVVFYQYCMPVNKKATWKMEQGKFAEAQIDELEKRRKLREYQLAKGTRKFHVWLNSKRLGLSGKLDLLIDSPVGLFPVDFKMTTGGPRRNHVMQLCGYARLLEDCYQREVRKGFVYLIPQNDAVVFDLTEERKREADELIGEIRRMIEKEQMPPPTPVRNRCDDCEFRNYCSDIFWVSFANRWGSGAENELAKKSDCRCGNKLCFFGLSIADEETFPTRRELKAGWARD